MSGGNTLGIIAGGGELPRAIAEAAAADGRDVFVLAIDGIADADWIKAYPHVVAALGEVGRALRLVKEAGCASVTFAGRVPRPNFSSLKLDARGAMALPKLIAAAAKGDDALLRAVLAIFENEGIKVIGSADAAKALLASEGVLTQRQPSDREREDVAAAFRIVRAVGALDVGQSAVVCEGLPLAVEAAEGTDAMLQRVASLAVTLRGTPEAKRGVVAKAPKPKQERRVDLPVVGLRTVRLAAEAGLAGIAVEAGATLLLSPRSVVEAADAAGLFVIGVAKDSSI